MISEETASRLCAACGLCCNGVLFFSAKLQPGDDARKLERLGLKVKRREGVQHMLQPCQAHRDMSCTIYGERPMRCRLFVCQQLRAVESGACSESEAATTIAQTLTQVAKVKSLLREMGETREHKALATRYESALEEPGGPPSPKGDALREAMMELEKTLAEKFRIAEPPCQS